MPAIILFAVAITAAPLMPPPSPLAGLEVCWQVRGQVEGKPMSATARGSRKLGGRYLLLELQGSNNNDPHDTAIIMADAGPGQLTGWWMDRFGGPGSAAGTGSVEADGFSISYAYPSARFVNRFRRVGLGWDWRIDARPGGGKASLFARYTLRPARCPARFGVF
jgi:hypothetical protein